MYFYLYGLSLQTLVMNLLYGLLLWTLPLHRLFIVSLSMNYPYGLFYRSFLSIFFINLFIDIYSVHRLSLWILLWTLCGIFLSSHAMDSMDSNGFCMDSPCSSFIGCIYRFSLSLYGFSLRTLSMDKLYRTLSLVLSINSLYRLSLATPVLVTSLFLRASGVHLNNQPDEYTLPDFAPLLLFISPLPASLMVFSSLSPPLVERSFYCRLLLLPFPLSPRFFPSPHPPLFPDNWKFMKSYV